MTINVVILSLFLCVTIYETDLGPAVECARFRYRDVGTIITDVTSAVATVRKTLIIDAVIPIQREPIFGAAQPTTLVLWKYIGMAMVKTVT